MSRRVGWVALAFVAAGALYIGVTDRSAPTADERLDRIGASIACPACAGESVRDSAVAVAVNIRRDIAKRIADGESDDEIRDALAAAYGDSILLTPPRTGAASLVWVLPVAAFVVAAAGLGFTFWRWRTT